MKIFNPKAALICILIFVSALTAKAQGEANTWYFGTNLGLDFNSNPPKVTGGYFNISSADGNTIECSSSISDENGNFLFGTSGPDVYNAAKNIVGFVSPVTHSATQGSMIIPKPGSANQYYLLSVPDGIFPNGCTSSSAFYKTVTVTGTTGNNISLSPSVSLKASNLLECQMVLPKFNSPDFWAVFHERGSNKFLVYSVTADSIGKPVEYNSGPVLSCMSSQYGISVMKANSCYNQFAFTFDQKIHFFNFDITTGSIEYNNSQQLEEAYGLEFSSNGQYLYTSTGSASVTPAVYRSTITGNTLGNPVKLGNLQGIRGGDLQYGPDGIIYCAAMANWVAMGAPSYLGAIINPNSTSATFNAQYIPLPSNISSPSRLGMGLPDFITSGYSNIGSVTANGLSISKQTICQGQTKQLKVLIDNIEIPSISWSVTTPANSTTTYNNNNISYTFNTAGTYVINYPITNVCGYAINKQISVIVQPTQAANVTTDISTCPKPTLKGTGSISGNYKWYDKAPENGGSLLSVGTQYQANASQSIWVEPAGVINDVTVKDTRQSVNFGTAANTTLITNTYLAARIDSFKISYNISYITGTFTAELRDAANILVGTPVSKTITTPTSTYSVTLIPSDWNLIAGNYSVVITQVASGTTVTQLTTSTYTYQGIKLEGGGAHSFVISAKEETQLACKQGKLITAPSCNFCTTPTPVLTIVSGVNPSCEGKSITLQASHSMQDVTNAIYQWYKNDNPITNSANNTLAFNSLSAADTGSYRVTIIGSDQCDNTSLASNTIKIDFATIQAPMVNSPVVYCQYDETSALSATGTNLSWYASETETIVLPAAPVPNTSVSGTSFYYVSQKSADGCESNRSEIEVIINEKPVIASVTTSTIESGDTVKITLNSTPAGATFDWNAVTIPENNLTTTTLNNSNGKIIQKIINTGSEAEKLTYFVSAELNGCQAEMIFIDQTINAAKVTGITDHLKNTEISVGPNPVRDLLVIKSLTSNALIEIIDKESGLAVVKQESDSNETVLSLGHLAAKMYFCKITTGQDVLVYKIIVE